MNKLTAFTASTLAACLLLGLIGCTKSCSPQQQAENSQEDKAQEKPKPDYSQVQVHKVVKRDLKPGTGKTVKEGDRVIVKYGMWIYDPKKKGNRGTSLNPKPNQEYSIRVGQGEVIKGFEQGLVGMKEGGLRSLIIPSPLAYGDKNPPKDVFPGAIILVEVDLLGIH